MRQIGDKKIIEVHLKKADEEEAGKCNIENVSTITVKNSTKPDQKNKEILNLFVILGDDLIKAK